jgi:low temperature requirement protein LtrA
MPLNMRHGVKWQNPRVTDEAAGAGNHGKRVTWVELYFDLIFVFAVGQVAHAIVVEPEWLRVLQALGLFGALWWTWIGFAVQYNRHGEDGRTVDRLIVLAGTIPCGIAATQAHHVFDGHPAGFALAVAGARLVLVVAAAAVPETRKRIAPGYAVSAVLFVVSVFLPQPWCYVVWAFALTQEGGFLLLSERRERIGLWRRGHAGSGRRIRDTLQREMFAPPRDPSQAVDSAHLAERFGLFMIILLGELVITVGTAALDRPRQDLAYWLTLVGGLVLAGALWWVYFSSAADLNERLLDISGGNPALAYSLYAGGHLTPAFALVLVAAGVGLSLHEHPPGSAPWFITVGLTIYFGGTRVFSSGSRRWYAGAGRLAAIAATVNLALLQRVVSAPVVVVVAAAWALLAAAVVSVFRANALRRLVADPAAFFRDAA